MLAAPSPIPADAYPDPRLTISAFCAEAEFPWLAGILREQIVCPVSIITGSSTTEAARRELGLRATEDGSMVENGVAVKVLKQNSCASMGWEARHLLLEIMRLLLRCAASPLAAVSLEYCSRLLEMVVTKDSAPIGHAPADRGFAPAAPIRHRAASLLDLNDASLTRAAGGLLQHLLKSRVVVEDASSDPPSLVLHGGVHLFGVDGFMHIDALSFAALSIFSREQHPSRIKLSGRAKEGFSLFTLLDRTAGNPGRRMLHTWCRQPSVDVDLIRHRCVGSERRSSRSLFCCIHASSSLPSLRSHDAVEVLSLCRSGVPEVYKDFRACFKVRGLKPPVVK